MSWGYIIAGVGLALGAAYYLSDKEKSAKRHYEREEREHSQTIDRSNRQIN